MEFECGDLFQYKILSGMIFSKRLWMEWTNSVTE
jgi:hypothetical protein